MYIWLIFFGILYVLGLGYSSYLAKKESQFDLKSFTLGGANLTVSLGILTYSGTLFSTFTLMGMPDFVRTHGVGAWIFLGVTDVAMAFIILLVGVKTRQKFQESGHFSVGCFLRDAYNNPYASLVFLTGVFIFLVPYTAIQIKGVALFLDSTIPLGFGYRFWAVSMLAVILTYTTVGGFKGIVYSDVIQGSIILIVSWLLAASCLDKAGGVANLFNSVREIRPELLSVPGPKGLFTTQFLLAAFLSIIVMPLSQPSLTTRIIAMKDNRSLTIMAPSIGFFAILIILPAICLGMYGAVHYAEISTAQFWNKILVTDQPDFLGALTVIAIMAAAMSTTDSQLFALSNEANLYFNKQKNTQIKTKSLIFLFATTSLLFALFSSSNIVPLATLSFTGTAILVPMFVLAIQKKDRVRYGTFMPIITFICLGLYTYFTLTLNEDKMVAGIRLDLILFAVVTVCAIGTYFFTRKQDKEHIMVDVIYKTSLSLLTDLYQLTMSYGYFKKKMSEREAVFHLFFRNNPFKGNYVVTSGLHDVIGFLKAFRFQKDDIDYLRGLTGSDDKPLFTEDYLQYLMKMEFTCDVDAVPEGRVVFPHEPLVRIRGPLIQGQILETALLNIINFQSLIATKSSRICFAADGDPVLEFGMRRSQGIDGALSASRSAYIGGVASTSNVLAGKIYDIPLKGTHAHSWIMSFPSEPEAFEAFAEVMPNNCVFLVDTYNTVQGIKNAIITGEKLLKKGHKMLGIRLDSGDLSQLSIIARTLLDEAGFKDADIVASNDLDEYTIQKLKAEGSKINVWGVGTRLVTGYDQPALGGVYKISAIKENNSWAYKIKISEDVIKISNPGLLQVRRYFKADTFLGDVMYNMEDHDQSAHFSGTTLDGKNQVNHEASSQYEDLLKPIFRKGKLVYKEPSLVESRERAQQDLKMLHKKYRELAKADEPYTVILETKLHSLKKSLMDKKN